MAITQALTTSFKAEVLEGIHDFSVGGDTFYLALYTNNSDLSSATTVYSSLGEVVSSGYTAGGQVLTNLGVSTSGTIAYTSWNSVSWPGEIIAASGGLIYNASKGNRAVAVLNFGGAYTTDGSNPFLITFPVYSNDAAPIIFN